MIQSNLNKMEDTASHKTAQKRSSKALFTLSYIVSHELKKLLQRPDVAKTLDQHHFGKFKHYFSQAIQILQAEEQSVSVASESENKKRVKFSQCFSDLAQVLGVTTTDDKPSAADDASVVNLTVQT